MGYSRPGHKPSRGASSTLFFHEKLPEFFAIFLGILLCPATSKGAAYISNTRAEAWDEPYVARPVPTVLMLEFHLSHFTGLSLKPWRLPPSSYVGPKLRRGKVLLAKSSTHRRRGVLTESLSSLCLVLYLTHEAPYTVLAILDMCAPFFYGGERGTTSSSTYEVLPHFQPKTAGLQKKKIHVGEQPAWPSSSASFFRHSRYGKLAGPMHSTKSMRLSRSR